MESPITPSKKSIRGRRSQSHRILTKYVPNTNFLFGVEPHPPVSIPIKLCFAPQTCESQPTTRRNNNSPRRFAERLVNNSSSHRIRLLECTKTEPKSPVKKFRFTAGFELLNKEFLREIDENPTLGAPSITLTKRKYGEILNRPILRSKSVPKSRNNKVGDLELYYEKLDKFKDSMCAMSRKFRIDEKMKEISEKTIENIRQRNYGAKSRACQRFEIKPHVTFFDAKSKKDPQQEGEFLTSAINMRQKRMKTIYEGLVDKTGKVAAKQLFSEYFAEGLKVVDTNQIEHDIQKKQKEEAEKKVELVVIKLVKKEENKKAVKNVAPASPIEKHYRRKKYAKQLLYQKKDPI